ncbi:hypothetical protein [Kordia jejudonensis]|uniref:hypothetical protein n=1 Tax=Kordia jejudonensis TaxID=1348245 RepID=UPI000629A22D|nr:hypothetical protein [Kordia jejudonensis]
MKKITILKIITLLIIMIVGILSLSSFNHTPENDIVGTWIHENDLENKWQFTNNGICKWLNTDNSVDETFTYTISYTSPQCGYEVKTNGTQFYYLKMIDADGDEYCYDINVDTTTLSINYLGTTGYDLYIKQ